MAAGYGTASATVVHKGVNCLLQHTLLVADYNLRGLQLNQPLQPVVAVNYPAVQIVKIAGGKPTAVQLYHWPQFGRQHWPYSEDHPIGLVAALAESLDYPDSLDSLFAALARRRPHFFLQVRPEQVQFDPFQHLQHGLGAHARLEYFGVTVAQLPESTFG